VLVDSSAWMRHFRAPDMLLNALLLQGKVRGHPDVAGELAMGRDPGAAECRDEVLALRSLQPVDRGRILELVSALAMNGSGIGWVDAGLIAACLESQAPVAIYTHDVRMGRAARRVGVPVVGVVG
jgi:hypothetical protein